MLEAAVLCGNLLPCRCVPQRGVWRVPFTFGGRNSVLGITSRLTLHITVTASMTLKADQVADKQSNAPVSIKADKGGGHIGLQKIM